MTHSVRPLFALLAANLLFLPPSPAACAETSEAWTREMAQGYGLPPADIGDGADVPYRRPPQDSAGLLVRIDRLENQLRQVNGQIEQLQFENRKLEDQLRKFQEDVDFRFQDGGRGTTPGSPGVARPLQKRTEAPEIMPESTTQAPRPGTTVVPTATPSRIGRRADAFDPSEDPTAPGAPRPLGTQAASAPNNQVVNWNSARAAPTRGAQPGLDPGDPDAPLDLSGGKLHGGQASAAPARPSLDASPTPSAPAPSAVTAGGTVIAAAPVNPVKEEYELALGYYRQKEYENAEKGFAAFLQKNPKAKMAPDAIYYLGESFFQRGRQREAAEQYLKLSTQYANAPRAPEALLRLGQSLYALGAKEQACATYGELARKYPNASATVKAGAEREGKRAQC